MSTDADQPDTPDPRHVMVVHGRDEAIRRAMFSFLRSIGLHPIEWSEAVNETGSAAPYVGDVLDRAFAMAQAVVVILTPDEEVVLRPGLRAEATPSENQPARQARPNVTFEAGMALAKHPDRTVLVEIGGVRAFSDIAGRHTVRMDGTVKRRQDVAQRLENAGCKVDISGRDWHDEGSFELSADPEGASLGEIFKRAEASAVMVQEFQAQASAQAERARGLEDTLVSALNEGHAMAARIEEAENRLSGFEEKVAILEGLLQNYRDQSTLGAYYDSHLYDVLESLQKVVRGTIPGVTVDVFVEQGVLNPAREFLTRGEGEDVRLSILEPDGDEFRMIFAAGHTLESKQRFRLPVEGSFAGFALRSGQIEFTGDVDLDERFVRHPKARPGRDYKSIISVPIRSGEQTVGVLNVISTFEDAFEEADFNYVRLIGAVLNVVWSMAADIPSTGDDPASDR